MEEVVGVVGEVVAGLCSARPTAANEGGVAASVCLSVGWFVTFCNGCWPRKGGISGNLMGPSFGNGCCDCGRGGRTC